MSSTDSRPLEQIRARVTKTLTDGIQLNMSTEESKKFLRRHVSSKTNLVVGIADINNSTQMSLSLPDNKFASMIQAFAQETSIAVSGYGGYVFKYEGDAVIFLFPAEYDQVKACENSLSCSATIQQIIKEVINCAFKASGLPKVTVRIGLDYGNTLVMLYGKSLEKAHLDIIGSSISMAAKIAAIAQPNQILIGESIYNILVSESHENFFRHNRFVRLKLHTRNWNYYSHFDLDRIYGVYEYLQK